MGNPCAKMTVLHVALTEYDWWELACHAGVDNMCQFARTAIEEKIIRERQIELDNHLRSHGL